MGAQYEMFMIIDSLRECGDDERNLAGPSIVCTTITVRRRLESNERAVNDETSIIPIHAFQLMGFAGDSPSFNLLEQYFQKIILGYEIQSLSQ